LIWFLFVVFLETPSNKGSDLAYCQNVASKLVDAKDLPVMCRSFPSVIDAVKRKATGKTDNNIAFQGMTAGSAIQARSSRATGYVSHAKLQRRLTSSGPGLKR
jgi:hypothetical protein